MDNQTNREGHYLAFKGESYSINLVFGLMKSAPKIDVEVKDLQLLGLTDFTDADVCKRYEALPKPALPEYGECEIAFYQQEGKFTVILGRVKAQRMIAAGVKTLVGRRISSPALKKARIQAYVKPPTVDIHKPIVEASYNDRRPPARTERRDERPRSYNDQKRFTVSNGTITRRDFNKS
jgi:hypothetical protein